MSSATAAPIIQFLNMLHMNNVECIVLYSSKYEWQKVSCRCMKVVCKHMKRIKIELT